MHLNVIWKELCGKNANLIDKLNSFFFETVNSLAGKKRSVEEERSKRGVCSEQSGRLLRASDARGPSESNKTSPIKVKTVHEGKLAASRGDTCSLAREHVQPREGAKRVLRFDN